MMKEYLKLLIAGNELTEIQTYEVFESLVLDSDRSDQTLTDAQIGAYLFALGSRLPTTPELTGAVKALRNHMTVFDTTSTINGATLLDTCGTGGSGKCSFNTSTAVALVMAQLGQHVVKHGNRKSSSITGSADILEKLGVNIYCSFEQSLMCLKETNFCFLLAPLYHPATKRVAQIRGQLGFRTIFNFLGPLANPACLSYQLLGVSNHQMIRPMAEALQQLGIKRALVVCGRDGLDEITLTYKTDVCELNNGILTNYAISPEDFDMDRVDEKEISCLELSEALEKFQGVLCGSNDVKNLACRQLVIINTAAALYICNKANSISDGVGLARDILSSEKTRKLLDRIIQITNSTNHQL